MTATEPTTATTNFGRGKKNNGNLRPPHSSYFTPEEIRREKITFLNEKKSSKVKLNIFRHSRSEE